MSSINKWEDRSEEIAYLLNPAFCGVVLCQFIKTYQQKKESFVPVALLYIVLPLILFPETRSSISGRKKIRKLGMRESENSSSICETSASSGVCSERGD